MAKQTISPVERHVEKVVLGIAGLVLLAVVVLFLIGSPNTVRLGGRQLGPAEADLFVKQKAEELGAKLRQARHERKQPEDYGDKLARVRQSGPLAIANVPAVLAQAVCWGQPVPDVGGSGSADSKVTLASVLPCERPKLSAGRTFGVVADPAEVSVYGQGRFEPSREGTRLAEEERQLREMLGETAVKDIYWVTLATTFDLAAQRANMKEHGYDFSHSLIHVVRFEVQRQELLGDGVWSAWQEVATYLPVRLPEAPEVTVGPDNRIPSLQWQQVGLFRNLLRDHQSDICRPAFPVEVQGGDEWKAPEIKGLKAVLAASKDIGLAGSRRGGYKGSSSDVGKGAYVASDPKDGGKGFSGPGGVYGGKGDFGRGEDAAGGVADALKQYRAALEAFDQGDLDEADKLVGQLEASRDLPGGYQRRLEQLRTKLDEAIFNKEQEEARRQLEMITARQQAEKEGKLEEWLEQYGLATKAYLWAHDLTVTPGRTYRYRARLVLYNWYVGVVSRLANAADAETIGLMGAWSAPSAQIAVEPETYFYLASADRQADEARVTIYKWHMGQWIKRPRDVRVRVGEEIGQKKRVPLPGADGESRRRLVEVDFRTGAVVVDIEHDRASKLLVPRGPDQFDLVSQSGPALVYLDASGRLCERLQLQDSQDPKRRELQNAVKRAMPSRAVRERAPVRQRTVGPRARQPGGRMIGGKGGDMGK